jgi:DNA (cytosine-5)-methyltransferase 1
MRKDTEKHASQSTDLSGVGLSLPLMSFTFVDLFAGIGGFHAALGSMGGKCVYASEIDKDAARIYQRNWGLAPDGDITLAANDEVMDVPPHDVLVGGFPCQPFSKSGKQMGMEETRGTLFWNIAKIVEVRKPSIVLLENVRNIAGPRHIHEWDVIISTLRQLGYRVSAQPLVVSPHLIRPEFGGRPQVRDRVFIAATRIPKGMKDTNKDVDVPDLSAVMMNWNPQSWNLEKDLPLDKPKTAATRKETALAETEMKWIEAWNEFVELMKVELEGKNLPGFPIWADDWVTTKELVIPSGTPDWKSNFLVKNAEFYTQHKKVLDKWLKKWNHLSDFPPSRRKLEWQAQNAKNLWATVMHFRPSGIRAKKATYLPALVAITQTSIVGKQKRRISTREAARLQGLPDWFDFVDQTTALTYKQLGNGVNVGAVYNVIRAQVLRDLDLLGENKLTKSILSAPASPDLVLTHHSDFHRTQEEAENRVEPVPPLRLVQ